MQKLGTSCCAVFMWLVKAYVKAKLFVFLVKAYAEAKLLFFLMERGSVKVSDDIFVVFCVLTEEMHLFVLLYFCTIGSETES